MWAAGAVITAMFAGDPIFAIQSARLSECDTAQTIEECDLSELRHLTKFGHHSREHYTWINMSGLAIDLVEKLLVLDPLQRLNATAGLDHPWFSDIKSLPCVKAISQMPTSPPSTYLDGLEDEIAPFIEMRQMESEVSKVRISQDDYLRKPKYEEAMRSVESQSCKLYPDSDHLAAQDTLPTSRSPFFANHG